MTTTLVINIFESSDKVSFFFDTDAFDKDGNLQVDLSKAINKIGHGLHIHNQLFQETTFDKKVQDIARSLNLKIPEFYRVCVFSSNQQQRHPTIPEIMLSHLTLTLRFIH